MILNLTQHPTSAEQAAGGVVEPREKSEVQKLLTFAELPSSIEIHQRAEELADIAKTQGFDSAMIAGVGFLMGPLEQALSERGITPLHAFSVRESKEIANADGSVTKTNVFRHVGFVKVL